jgi:hypothetical protein
MKDRNVMAGKDLSTLPLFPKRKRAQRRWFFVAPGVTASDPLTLELEDKLQAQLHVARTPIGVDFIVTSVVAVDQARSTI